MSTLYVGSGNASCYSGPPCYCKFLRGALRPLGAGDFPFLSPERFAWGRSVVFFDTEEVRFDWVSIVEHLLDQNNIVIVISDDVICDVDALRHTRAIILPRTWEAEEVRAVFNQAQDELAALLAGKTEKEEV